MYLQLSICIFANYTMIIIHPYSAKRWRIETNDAPLHIVVDNSVLHVIVFQNIENILHLVRWHQQLCGTANAKRVQEESYLKIRLPQQHIFFCIHLIIIAKQA